MKDTTKTLRTSITHLTKSDINTVMASLFQKLELEAFRKGITPRTRESREWFRKQAGAMRGIVRKGLLLDDAVKRGSRPYPGRMYMFYYDPKTKDTLPYYDRFPLVIMIGKAPGGFHGLNLHYISPVHRAKLLDALLDITNNNAYDESTRFQVSYGLLTKAAKYKYFKPCFKHYLTDHVRSRFAEVAAPEWEIATFLPVADWEKSTAANVYSNSSRMY